MSSEHVEEFTTSLGGDATVHETTAAEASARIEEAITEPAIATPLGIEGVSLSDTPVETDFSPVDLEAAATGVTPARIGISDYGTVTLPSDAAGTELASLYCRRHVAVVAASDVAPGMKHAYEEVSADFAEGVDTQILATGPSATADMGTLVQGVHGPHEVHIVVVTDR